MLHNHSPKLSSYSSISARLGMMLAFGLGLALALLWLLGGASLSVVQAGPPARSLFAPASTGITPTSNALDVPMTSDVSITFDEPIDIASVTSRTFAVYGSQSPIFAGTYSLSNLSRTVTLDPARNFFPGERIEAIVTTATLNITGEQATFATVWQFWAAVDGGSGHFDTITTTVSPDNDRTGCLALGDVDGDGSLDLAVGNDGQNEVYVNDGDGTFDTMSHNVGPGDSATTSLALGDVDGDGDLDLAVGNWDGQNVVYVNDGDGTFDAITYTVGSGSDPTASLALGDVDGDGNLDLVVGNWGGQNVVYVNDGDGTFDTITHTVGPGDDATIVLGLGDVDGDGDLDLAVGNQDQQNVVYVNDGDGTFDTTSHNVGPGDDSTYSLALGDVDGDGGLDLVVGNYGQQNVVYVNDGDGTFDTTSHDIGPSDDSTYSLALGDVDGDGDLDLAVGNYDQQNVVYVNDGDGTFDTTSHNVGPGDDDTYSLALGDVDGDGDLDLAVGNQNQQNVVYFNQNQANLAITKTASPDPVIAGRSVAYTITVVNSGPEPATGIALSDTLPLSTSLHHVDQADDGGGLLGFEGGTHQNTRWIDPRPLVPTDEWLELLNPTIGTGVFTSRLIDAYNVVDWTSLTWTPRRPYWKALPDGGQIETAYDLGNANMTGNQALLHLDESAGATSFTDASGLNHHGTCPAVAGETCPTAGMNGRFNGALGFNGAQSNTVTIADATDPTRYALELWVRPAVVTDTSFILRTDTVSGTTDHFSHLLGISGGRFLHYVNGRAITGTTTIVAGTWYHVVGTAQSGGDSKLYVNGVEEGSLGGLGTLWMGGDHYRLGSAYGLTGTTYFSGELDEVAVYDRTLSAAEVADHYLRGALRLSFQVRACSAPCTSETFVGPGGLATTVYSELSNTSPTDLPSVTLAGTLGRRYFQYQATLETDTPPYSPELQRVSVGPGHRAVSATVGTCVAPSARAFTCTFDSLPSGGTITVTTSAYIDYAALGIITNTATVTATSVDTDALDNRAYVASTVEARADFIILKDDAEWNGGTDPVSPGSPMTYTLRVRNAGPSLGRSVQVTDTLPATVTGVYAPDGWGDACQFSGKTVTCTVASLVPSGYRWDQVYDWQEVVIMATTPITTGSITNTAGVTSTTPELDAGDNVITETTLITLVADIAIAKSAAPSPVDPEGTLTYTVSVTNNGPYTATNVVVTDTLPPGLAGNVLVGDDWTCVSLGGRVTCSLNDPLTPTLSVSFNITVTAPLTGFLANHAFVTADQVDPEFDNNFAAAYAAVLPVADLSISKSDVVDPVDAGAPLAYTLTITNTGPAPAGALTTTLTANNGSTFDVPLLEGAATPYRSSVYLSNVPGLIRNVTVTLNDLSHSYPADLSILLVGPGEQGVVLMANAGGGWDATGVTLTFNDAGTSLPSNMPLNSAVVYRPTNNGFSTDMVPPAPPGPYGGSLSTFNGSSPNGAWRLYVYDNVYSDDGEISNGWSLQVTAVTTDTVTVTDTLPSGLSEVGVPSPSGWMCGASSSSVRCVSERLEMNVPTIFSIDATAPAVGGVITNTAGITSTVHDPHPFDNSAFVTTTVNSPAVSVTLCLPVMMRNYVAAPDLVVDSVIATSDDVQIVISNQGDRPVEDEFWVDAYIDPDTPPTQVNQTWKHVGSQGLVWGVTVAALPLQPGDVLTLTVSGGTYYWPSESQVTWPLPVGTPVYAQVDSAHASTLYGGVLENHEIIGGPYDNILGPVLSTAATGAVPSHDGQVKPALTDDLPPRP